METRRQGNFMWSASQGFSHFKYGVNEKVTLNKDMRKMNEKATWTSQGEKFQAGERASAKAEI